MKIKHAKHFFCKYRICPANLDREYWIRRKKDTFWRVFWSFWSIFHLWISADKKTAYNEVHLYSVLVLMGGFESGILLFSLQILTTHAWIQMKWTDSRLKWNPDDWNGVTMLRIEPDLLWIPDIVPYNGEQTRPNFITLNDNMPSVRIRSRQFFLKVFINRVSAHTYLYQYK